MLKPFDREELHARLQVGRRIDESSPMVDARLPDGSRVNAIIPPLAVDGPLLSIRRFGRTALKGEDLVKFMALTVSTSRDDVVKLMQAGVDGYITKTTLGADLPDLVRQTYVGARPVSMKPRRVPGAWPTLNASPAAAGTSIERATASATSPE